MFFSGKLRLLRTEAGLTQDALAEQLHCSAQEVSEWEAGQVVPNRDTILKLSEVFGVSVDSLLKEQAVCFHKPMPERKTSFILTSVFFMLIWISGFVLFIVNFLAEWFENSITFIALGFMFFSFLLFIINVFAYNHTPKGGPRIK